MHRTSSMSMPNTVKTTTKGQSLSPEAPPWPLSEDALADHFASKWCNQLRYVKQWRRWYVWDGLRWREDSTALSCRLAIELVRQACYWPEATSLTHEERRALDSKRTAWSMLALAGTDRRLAATAEQVGVEPPVRWRRKKGAET